MTLIELENGFKIRFDHNEVRINIDGEMIDVGARRNYESKEGILYAETGRFVKNTEGKWIKLPDDVDQEQ